jgi:hypothetical protein
MLALVARIEGMIVPQSGFVAATGPVGKRGLFRKKDARSDMYPIPIDNVLRCHSDFLAVPYQQIGWIRHESGEANLAKYE